MLGIAASGAVPASVVLARGLEGPQVFALDLFTNLASTRIPLPAGIIQTAGYAVAGRGGARYVFDTDQQSTSTNPWRARDADGRWWVLAEQVPTYEMFGAGAGGIARLTDRAALQAANDYAAAAGIQEVHATPAATYITDREVQAGEGVVNALNGATIQATLMHPDDAALSVRSRSAWKNGRVIVTSGVLPGAQANCHAGVRAGPIIGRSLSSRMIDPQEGIRGWILEDLVIETHAWSHETGAGKVAVQITGGTSDWIVRRVTAPDSAVMAGLIHADWAAVGPIVSEDNRQQANRESYSAAPRRGWTTHPNHGLIEACHGARFTAPATGTDTGSDGIRLSGCHDVVVRNCSMKATTYSSVRVVAGDLGFEFALPEQRARAHLGLVVDTFVVDDAGQGHACWIDLKADNVHRSVQSGRYSQMLNTIPDTDIIVRSLGGSTRSGRSSGLRLNNLTGGQFIDCVLNGFGDGIQIDEGVSRARLIRPVTRNSKRHGGVIDHVGLRPSEVTVEQPVAEWSGSAVDGAHWLFGNCDRCEVLGGTLGAPRGETARWGIVLERNGIQNKVRGAPGIIVRPGGQAIVDRQAVREARARKASRVIAESVSVDL